MASSHATHASGSRSAAITALRCSPHTSWGEGGGGIIDPARASASVKRHALSRLLTFAAGWRTPTLRCSLALAGDAVGTQRLTKLQRAVGLSRLALLAVLQCEMTTAAGAPLQVCRRARGARQACARRGPHVQLCSGIPSQRGNVAASEMHWWWESPGEPGSEQRSQRARPVRECHQSPAELKATQEEQQHLSAAKDAGVPEAPASHACVPRRIALKSGKPTGPSGVCARRNVARTCALAPGRLRPRSRRQPFSWEAR